jgi:methylated-DNA-[protein]-cysteine S-methyltransferase
MGKRTQYTIFKTKWGYFGLAAGEKGLIRSVLPCLNRKPVERYLLAGLENPRFEKNLLKPLQKRIIAYFAGKPTKFEAPIDLTNLPAFTRKVLQVCTRIPSGKTVSYSQLAAMVGNPRAGRAVGNALAKNPIPLIIPCHRVIHSDGSIGAFSAPGGTTLKQKLINLEK